MSCNDVVCVSAVELKLHTWSRPRIAVNPSRVCQMAEAAADPKQSADLGSVVRGFAGTGEIHIEMMHEHWAAEVEYRKAWDTDGDPSSSRSIVCRAINSNDDVRAIGTCKMVKTTELRRHEAASAEASWKKTLRQRRFAWAPAARVARQGGCYGVWLVLRWHVG